MKLTAKLAYSQLIINRRRTVWTLVGIILSVAMITAICGFMASGDDLFARMLGESYYDGIATLTVVGIGTILGSIIAAVSIVVISNAFRVSAGERTAQFGILKSVGATKKQIAATVMYEGLLLSFIGIPLGMAIGMALHLAGVEISNHLLTTINKLNREANSGTQINIYFILKWWTVAASGVLSFITVLLSAWLPARKAAKITAINAIRGTGDIKIKSKKNRSNWLIQKLFGFEGALASKSLKRSRKNFRATVVSLIVSIILVIAADVIGTFGFNVTGAFYPDLNITVVADYESIIKTIEYRDADGNITSERETYPLEYEIAEQVAAKFREYPDTTVFGVGVNFETNFTEVPYEMITPKLRETLGLAQGEGYNTNIIFTSIDKENYTKLCETAGVPYGSNILINRNKTVNDSTISDFEPFIFKNPISLNIKKNYNVVDGRETYDESEFILHGALSLNQVPNEILSFMDDHVFNVQINVIVPEQGAMSYEWLVNATDDEGFTAYANGVLQEILPQGEEYNATVASIADLNQAMKDMRNLLLTFIYGFVGMLILVGLTNVISTISTNIQSRSREFAVLRSTGMTDSGLKKMLNLESILSSARALLFGLPIGCTLSYLIYQSTVKTADFPYEFPLIAVAECIIGVFAVTWITMRYSAARLRGRNIIDAIRSENGT